MKSMWFFISVLTGGLVVFSACRQETISAQAGLLYQSSFQRDADGWVGGISDYSAEQAAGMQFKSARTGLPAPLDSDRNSLMLESINRSDDAFMFLKKKLTGLQPNADYNLVFDIELASQYPDNSVGIGGSPGSSVFLKAGASPVEPVNELKDGFYSLNIDKGEQNNDGKNAIRLGNIGTGDAAGYTLITRSNANKPFVVTASDKGELWLLIGTDSGFEGLTTLYYSSIKVTIR